MKPLMLTGEALTLEELYQVAYDHRKVEIDPEAVDRVDRARQILFDMAAEGKPVYGLNRGVGWNKDKEFDKEFFEQYNRNLLNTHCLGVPPYHNKPEARAIMLIRLNKVLLGCTGISSDLLHCFVEYLNEDIMPLIPRRSSVGEGDITTLSHLGMAFIGEEQVIYKDEQMLSGAAMEAIGLSIPTLGPKDGLSILSSNAQGEAMAALNVKEAEDLIDTANLVACLSLEGINGVMESYRSDVNDLRQLRGQIKSAQKMREHLEGSFLHEKDPNRQIQDPLSFRCAHAIHGTTIDALDFIKEHLEIQLNATDDNPCIVLEDGTSYVSGNFETTTLSIGVEMLGIALSHLSKGSCYRTMKLADPAFTGLTRFLTPQEVVTIAYGTIQKTYTSLDTEIRYLANPSSMDFFSVAGNIEDHASNLPIASDKVFKILDNLRYIIGIEAMHAVQAIDLRGKKPLGVDTAKAYEKIRAVVPYYDKDRNISKDIAAMYELIKSNALIKK